MSQALGFKFDRVQLRRGVYYPKGLGDNEAAFMQIQQGLVAVLAGERPLQMKVTEFPNSPELIAAQIAMMERNSKAYTEDGSMRIKIEGNLPPQSRERNR